MQPQQLLVDHPVDQVEPAKASHDRPQVRRPQRPTGPAASSTATNPTTNATASTRSSSPSEVSPTATVDRSSK
jgi:hypothetical protein